MMPRFVALAVMAASLWLSGCSDDTSGFDCVPSEAEWNSEVSAIVADRCQRCHASEPIFGAPFPLVDYAHTQAMSHGERISDRMIEQLVSGAMPPADSTQPTAAERQRIIDWARCRVPGDAGM